MKSFKVPVKNADEDYIVTGNLWLTLNCQKNGCTFLKKDNKNELLFGFSEGREAADAAAGGLNGSSMSAVFMHLAEKKRPVCLFYINGFENKIFYSSASDKTGIQVVLFRSKKKDAVILTNSGEMKADDGDVLVGFSGKVPQAALESLGEVLRIKGHIAYLQIQDMIAYLSSVDAGVTPLFQIDFSDHQSYSFPIKSSLKTVSLTIDMIKNKLVKHDLEKIWQVETVLHEALVNAITYGNDLDSSKNVEISYEMGRKGLRITVKDKGAGFDVNNITVPVGTEALEKVNGRGIYIMQKFTDAIFFNEKGNELVLFFNF